VVHEDQVGYANEAEVDAERVDPEVVLLDRVAHGDVTGDAFVEAALGEEAERGREAALAVQALFFRVLEGGGLEEFHVVFEAGHGFDPSTGEGATQARGRQYAHS
jgi:hypothetical protein